MMARKEGVLGRWLEWRKGSGRAGLMDELVEITLTGIENNQARKIAKKEQKIKEKQAYQTWLDQLDKIPYWDWPASEKRGTSAAEIKMQRLKGLSLEDEIIERALKKADPQELQKDFNQLKAIREKIFYNPSQLLKLAAKLDQIEKQLAKHNQSFSLAKPWELEDLVGLYRQNSRVQDTYGERMGVNIAGASKILLVFEQVINALERNDLDLNLDQLLDLQKQQEVVFLCPEAIRNRVENKDYLYLHGHTCTFFGLNETGLAELKDPNDDHNGFYVHPDFIYK